MNFMSDQMVERDILLSLGVGGEATDPQWDVIAAQARQDHAFARDFVLHARDQAALSSMMSEADAIAARVDLPASHVAPRSAGSEPLRVVPHGSVHTEGGTAGRLGAWAGWLVAACLLAGFLKIGQTPPSAPEGRGNAMQAGLGTTAEDALRVYLDRGRSEDRVIDEMPHRLLLESRPLADGSGTELLYLRQFLERTVVPDLYRLDGQNELGQPSFVRYVPHSGGSL